MSMAGKYVGPALAVVVITATLALMRKKWTSRHLLFPPGPKGYPMIGNIFDFPKDPIWEGFARMTREHDTNLLHLDVMGSHIVALSDSDVAADLIAQRSYSDRPQFPMVNDLMGCKWAFSLMHYGSTWRTHRRLFHKFFNIAVVDQFDNSIQQAVNVFLNRLSENPERFLKHVHFLTGSLPLSITYGLDMKSESNSFYTASREAMNAVETALTPGAFLVDFFPMLKHVPEWFPGAGFKKFARVAKKTIDDSIDLPFQHVKEAFQADSVTTPSFVATCLEELPELMKDGVDEKVIRNVGGVIFLGSVETTASSIETFFLAATLHPEVVRLAQKELDVVTGGERLPDFSDKPQLPYISAVMKEVLRWGPPAPLASTRRVMEDGVYKGFCIPAGTAVVGNSWAMFRDESVYPDAHTFNPGRFLKDGRINPDVKDPEQMVFGWGRRICPGRHFALRVLFLTIARTLATFDISKCVGEDGNPIVPDVKYTHGGITHPLPFRSDVKPRSVHSLSLIAGE